MKHLWTGPAVQVFLSGDAEKAAQWIRKARSLIGYLMGITPENDSRVWRRTLEDETTIIVMTFRSFGNKRAIVRIDSPTSGQITGQSSIYLDSGFIAVPSWGDPINCSIVNGRLEQNNLTRTLLGFVGSGHLKALKPALPDAIDNWNNPPSFLFSDAATKCFLYQKVKNYYSITGGAFALSGRAKLYAASKAGLKIGSKAFAYLLTSSALPNTNGTGIYEDPTNKSQWLVQISVGTDITISYLKMSVRGSLMAEYRAENDDEKRLILLAYIYATAKLDSSLEYVHVNKPAAFAGLPLAYGWKFNWAGTKASIVVHEYKGISDNYKHIGRLFTLSFNWERTNNVLEMAPVLTKVSEVYWKCQVGFIVEYTNSVFGAPGTCIMPGPGIGTGYTFSSAPLYCYYSANSNYENNTLLVLLGSLSVTASAVDGYCNADHSLVARPEPQLGQSYAFGRTWSSKTTATLKWDEGSGSATASTGTYYGQDKLSSLEDLGHVGPIPAGVQSFGVGHATYGPCGFIANVIDYNSGYACGITLEYDDHRATFISNTLSGGTVGGTTVIPPWNNGEAVFLNAAERYILSYDRRDTNIFNTWFWETTYHLALPSPDCSNVTISDITDYKLNGGNLSSSLTHPPSEFSGTVVSYYLHKFGHKKRTDTPSSPTQYFPGEHW